MFQIHQQVRGIREVFQKNCNSIDIYLIPDKLWDYDELEFRKQLLDAFSGSTLESDSDIVDIVE